MPYPNDDRRPEDFWMGLAALAFLLIVAMTCQTPPLSEEQKAEARARAAREHQAESAEHAARIEQNKRRD